MPDKKKFCAETGKEIGPAVGIDVYKYTVSTFHLPNLGREQLLKIYGDQKSEYARRIVKNLTEEKG